MRVELLLERNANVIVHEDVDNVEWTDTTVIVQKEGYIDSYSYVLRNLSWLRERQ